MELTLPGKLQKALEREAEDAKRTLHAHLVRKLENITPPAESIDPKPLHANLPRLVAYLERMPGVSVLSSDCLLYTSNQRIKIIVLDTLSPCPRPATNSWWTNWRPTSAKAGCGPACACRRTANWPRAKGWR